jgi:hypothetical protein
MIAMSSRGFLPVDVVRLFLSPGELFTHLAEGNRYPSALLFLVFCQVVFASAVLSTGVVDYELDARAGERFSRLANSLQQDDSSSADNQAVEAVEKEAAFTRLLVRLGWLLGGPLRLLAGVAVTVGALFVAVSLAGRKADLPLLAGIVTFASFVELARMLAVLLVVWQRQTTRVDLSAAAWFDGSVGLPAYLLLRCLDPFSLWYWGLLGLGLWKTGQLGGRAACRTVLLLAAVSAAAGAVLDLLTRTDLSRLLLGF